MNYKEALKDTKIIKEQLEEDFQRADKGVLAYYIDTYIEALEKQIPKKPVFLGEGYDYIYHCPTCKRYIERGHRCHNNACGQAIDWGEE